MKNIFVILVSAVVLVLSATQCGGDGRYYVKHVEFPEGASTEDKVEMAARLVPTEQQLAWQQMELSAFLHFGINTFTNREWGDGKEDPALFNPTDLDAGQWVRILSEAGFKMVIITAKHHDGFCLWPTKTTDHSVASSPWKDGKGDVVREVREACDRYGMKFGVYLSPWDRNAACYGTPEYNDYFMAQLTELLTEYGEVDEVWFDGANGEGPDGRKQKYDWEAFYETIRRLQPNAVMSIMGDDVRWVGNEKGVGRESEWSATVLTPGVYARSERNNRRLRVKETSPDLGSRLVLEKAGELFWYPSEVDVSVRPGWFWHEKENERVKSLRHLVDIYFQSVGYNSGLLLNVPPDTRGRISEADSVRIGEFADYLRQTFVNDMVIGGDRLWKAAGGNSMVYELKPDSEINVVMLQENIAHGQRVDSFSVEVLAGDDWIRVGEGTTVGYKRLLRFPAVKASAIRVTLGQTRTKAEISRVGAFFAEVLRENSDEPGFNDIPHEEWTIVDGEPLTVDLGKVYTLAGVTYIPDETAHEASVRNDTSILSAGTGLGYAFHYSVEISKNGKKWYAIVPGGEFGNIMYNPVPQTIPFGKNTFAYARYIRFSAQTEDGGPAAVSPDEFGVILAWPDEDRRCTYIDVDKIK